MLILAAWLFSPAIYSQEIRGVDFEVIGNTIKIRYDIGGCSDNETYDVKLSLKVDGKSTEVINGLSGDVKNVACGNSRLIVWDVLSDRDELKGKISFAVHIERVYHSPPQTQKAKEEKGWSRRSWKADKGYIGGSIGIFTPYQTYSPIPYDLEQHGLFLNTTVAYLPSLFLGISSTIFVYGIAENNEFNVDSWTSCGITLGPLISVPIGNKIKWEVRPQIGYSMIAADSKKSDLDSLGVIRHGVVYSIGTGLRLNFGKRTCYLLNVDYISTATKVDDYPIVPEIGTLGVSFGVAFRFY
ncbi:MAG TPA: hypothetical protein VFZ52_13910 [Chryseolinea sp.]